MNKQLDIWQKFIQTELKIGSKLGTLFEKANFDSLDNKILILVFEDENLAKTAKGQIEPLKKKLPRELTPCDRIQIQTGKISTMKASVPSSNSKKQKSMNSLQALNFAEFKNELPKPVLEAAVSAEKNCQELYNILQKRTKSLVGNEGITFAVDFNWRVRVGGTRGFRELLLPVFHPIFGVPYIPASSLKGAARAWARSKNNTEIDNLLGFLDKTAAAKVEILDAFPTKPCLSVDVSTPQWQWKENKVSYKPEPHPLLSMEQPNLCIGLRPTARGNANDVEEVKKWLENALKVGIGSRVSSGYGKALGQVYSFSHNKSFDFELWTQGMFGAETNKVEFRPTALRGILRYWFRAVALSLYPPDIVQDLENEIFGKLSQQGEIAISTIVNPSQKKNPYYTGKIYLEAKNQGILNLLEKILILASHLGGFGRSSRRPLHLLNKRMRGCHWTIEDSQFPLEYNKEQWQKLFSDLHAAFELIKLPIAKYQSDPGLLGSRYQDVLDSNAQIWLLQSPNQIEPSEVDNWQSQGDQENVRGSALNLLYSDNKFKGGEHQNQGNENVGGKLGTPSYVWIKSIFPANNKAYQVVTIFGVNHPDRKAFVKELQTQKAILVVGDISLLSASTKVIKPTIKPNLKPKHNL